MMKIKTVCKMVGTWNPQDMAEGMNYLSEKARAGKVFHHIYSEAERQSDSSKQLTGIASHKRANLWLRALAAGMRPSALW